MSMNLEHEILSLIREQGKLLKKLERLSKQPDWLTAEKVKSEFGIGKKFLQQKRKDGTIKNFRFINGKNFQYLRSEIEKLFITIKN